MSEKPIDNGLYGSWRDLYDEPGGIRPSVMPSVPRAEESKTAAPRVPEHVMAELLGQVNAPFNHELVINRMYDVVPKLNDRLGA